MSSCGSSARSEEDDVPRVNVRLRQFCALAALLGAAFALSACSIPPAPNTSSDRSVDTSATGHSLTTSASGAGSPLSTTGPAADSKGVPVPAGLHSPKTGSAERAAILDALRVPIEKELGQPVLFQVSVIQSKGNWAYIRATPLAPNGDRVDYRKTKYREQVENGAFDDAVDALAKNTDGSWRVVAYSVGATDVAWTPWPGRFGAPEAIFTAQ
jgi:hypothetical protein